jgi:predicted pyridoxine 5'-phosphate oxidase superfamily flavin-nucleotide-binding protein
MRTDHTPFHAGELRLQEATGVTREAASLSRAIGSQIAANAVEFVGQRQLAIVATTDDRGRPWCSALIGAPGAFVVVDPVTVDLDVRGGIVGDAIVERAPYGAPIGLLFIDPSTRRRYRVNGIVTEADDRRIGVQVVDAYPNCPKYIQRRELRIANPDVADGSVAVGTHLGAAERTCIEAADTFFVASSGPDGKLDASHRGGPSGFVRIDGDRLWIPDYAGNNMYNTLGNLAVRPIGGLLFVDFRRGTAMQLSGTVEIDLHSDDPATGGTHRAWTFTVTEWRRSRLAARFHVDELPTPSP